MPHASSAHLVSILLNFYCVARLSEAVAASVTLAARGSMTQGGEHVSFLQGRSLLRTEQMSSSVQTIINGTAVSNSSSQYSFYALPTQGENIDKWLGCGASIISPTWGMTAAHCFGGGQAPCSGPKKVGLWVGDMNLAPDFTVTPKSPGRSHKVTAEVVCHKDFDGHCSHGHDIVLLKLSGSLPSWVKPPRLSLDGAGSEAVGTVTRNMGYGLAESSSDSQLIEDSPTPQMREANLTIFDDTYPACADVYAGGYGCSDNYSEGEASNKGQQLCAGATDDPQRDTCSGDSGSPMIDSNGFQVGIVSYGGGPGHAMRGPGRICADPKYMGVYTRVSAFKDFINENVKDLPTA